MDESKFKRTFLLSLITFYISSVYAEDQFHYGTIISKKSSIEYGIGISYVLQNQITYSKATSSTLGTGESVVNYDRSVSIDLEARYLPAKSYGIIGNVSYELEKSADTEKFKGSQVTWPGGRPKLQTTAIELNAAYRWDMYYVPAGINYGIYNYTPPGTAFTGSQSTNGGVGWQAGIGFFAWKRTPIEIKYKTMTISQKIDYGSGNVQDYGAGTMTAVQTGIKYQF